MTNSDLFILFLQITFVGAAIVQLLFWLLVFSKIAFYKNSKNKAKIKENTSFHKTLPSVSIIVCAKNEEKNLFQNLHRILNQNYHSFEVLVVDDHSTDNTWQVLLEYQKKYPYLRIIKNNYIKKIIGKKSALSVGIAAAQHEILLLTDADCYPINQNWIETCVVSLGEKDILLAYSPYEKAENWLNRFVRFEAISTAIQYFSFALIGLPYMGVGRNLMYRKKIYDIANGFETHAHIASGDDDLFINQVANKKNTAICLQKDSFCYSEPKKTWSSYAKQKSRHLTTGKYYRWYHQLLLAAQGASHAYFYAAAALLLLLGNVKLIFFFYTVRSIVIAILYHLILKKLHEPSLGKHLFVLDAMMALYYAIAAPVSFIAKTKQWK